MCKPVVDLGVQPLTVYVAQYWDCMPDQMIKLGCNHSPQTALFVPQLPQILPYKYAVKVVY